MRGGACPGTPSAAMIGSSTPCKSSLRQGRFPHALLFVGPEGIGKRTFARKLAQALLCETRPDIELDPCEACPGCLQVEAGTHPDFIEAAKPEDKHELPISVIRELCDQFGLKPARGGRKVAILDDADDLNEEASNAFLKTLEEPPPGAVLILDRHVGRAPARDRSSRAARSCGSTRSPSRRSPPCCSKKASRKTQPTRPAWPPWARGASAAPSDWPMPSSSGFAGH